MFVRWPITAMGQILVVLGDNRGLTASAQRPANCV